MNNTTILLEHLTISLLPWLPGTLMGGSLGYILARLFHRILIKKPNLENFYFFLPWRTAAILLAVMAIFTPYPFIFIGPGPKAAIASMFFLVFVLATAYTASAYLDYWLRSSPAARVFGMSRTLGIVSVVVAILSGFSGAGGAWSLIWIGMREYDYTRMWVGYAIVAGLALILDLLLGAIHVSIALRVESGLRERSARVEWWSE